MTEIASIKTQLMLYSIIRERQIPGYNLD